MSLPTKEGLKEIARWLVCSIASWIIVQLLAQITVVPVNYVVKVWLFTFAIPIRMLFQLGITMLGRYIDKWQHETSKISEVYPVGQTPSFGWLNLFIK